MRKKVRFFVVMPEYRYNMVLITLEAEFSQDGNLKVYEFTAKALIEEIKKHYSANPSVKFADGIDERSVKIFSSDLTLVFENTNNTAAETLLKLTQSVGDSHLVRIDNRALTPTIASQDATPPQPTIPSISGSMSQTSWFKPT